MKKIFLLSTLFVSIIATSPLRGEQTIATEINELLKNDIDIQQRKNIKDSQLRFFLYLIDIIKDRAKDKNYSWFDALFFNTIQFNNVGGLIYLPEEKAPKLHAMVNELAQKSGIPKPDIFLAGDDDQFNAFADSFSPSTSMIVLCKKLIDNVSDEALRGVIGHELGHIKYYHSPKQIALGLSALGIVIGATIVAYKSVNHHDANTQPAQYIPPSTWDYIKWGTAIATIISMPILLMLMSRYFEEQADGESINIAGAKAYLTAMQAFKDHADQEYTQFEKDFSYCLEQLAALKTTWPEKWADLEKNLGKYRDEFFALYQNMLTQAITHPSLESRIKRGQAATTPTSQSPHQKTIQDS